MQIALYLDKSIEENASLYFEKAKKSKKKLEGAKEALQKSKKKLDKVVVPEVSAPARSRMKKEWYEKFRWFFSSEDILVIGGRDATSNEILIKKYTEPHDIVFHTDMAGSPFFVIKTEGRTPKETLKEAAVATASYSRAWKNGLSRQDVFYVRPEQVSKKAKAGESLPKGAFMIYGETKYMENHMELAVGVKEGRCIGGPKSAVAKHSKEYVLIRQGATKPSDAAKIAAKVLGCSVDDVMSFLPAGGCDVKRPEKRRKR